METQNQKTTTENGIQVASYTQDRANGLALLLKGVGGNYIYQRATFRVATVDGRPALVADTPTLINVNRQSLSDFNALLDVQLEQITQLRAQAAAILQDMDALDRV